MSDAAHPHEIVIIKRHGGGHEDGHHGGAWKIAYADFVTAMMAFFLVMWLISANDKTKAVVAHYFNPVQLVDSTPQPPGLSDPKDKNQNVSKPGTKQPPDDGASTPSKSTPAKQDLGHSESGDEKARREEAEVLKDPYAALADIAAKATGASARNAAPAKAAPSTSAGSNGGGLAEAKGGEAFRDPFAPVLASAPPGSAMPDTVVTPAARLDAAGRETADPAAPPTPADTSARAADLKTRIAALAKAVTEASQGGGPRIDVRATPDGVLIALTDEAGFSMFATASARPSPQTVLLMEKIGRILKAQKGGVVIRGYTDSRKFKSDTYDNWRLSAARAQMAHYMLVRGGLDDDRFDRIEGYADRQPRNLKDRESPENRRIEILVRSTP